MKDFSSSQRGEASRRNEEKKNIAIKFLARDTERQRMAQCLTNLNIHMEKQINYNFHLADATKMEEYIKKIPLEKNILHDKSISNLDFFLILLSRLIKKEYFNVTLTFIFLKMNENFTRNFLLNRKSQINKGSQINNEWLQIFLKYS